MLGAAIRGGTVTGIDVTFLKKVGASKSTALMRSLITSGTNRLESCSYYIWIGYIVEETKDQARLTEQK